MHKRHRERSYIPPVSRREAERTEMEQALAFAKTRQIVPLTIAEQDGMERVRRGKPAKNRPPRPGEPGYPTANG